MTRNKTTTVWQTGEETKIKDTKIAFCLMKDIHWCVCLHGDHEIGNVLYDLLTQHERLPLTTRDATISFFCFSNN
jgi:hypothetical protein